MKIENLWSLFKTLVYKSPIILIDLKENSSYLVKFKNKGYNKIIHGAKYKCTL